jgi:hypothetical protein
MNGDALECLIDVDSGKLAKLRAKTDRQLADYVRARLILAVQLACKVEQERRWARWESAEEYQCQWHEVMAEVKRLLPLMRTSGVPRLASPKPEEHRPPQKRR